MNRQNKKPTAAEKKKIGTITLITGSMFAGKTTALIEKYNNIKPFRPILVFKPQIDTRYSSSEIVSRGGEKVEAILINHIFEVERCLNNFIALKIKDIIIDELHFFSPESYIHLEDLAKKGINITLAGLDWDYFQNKPFATTANCLTIANEIIKLTAECDYKTKGNIIADRECNVPATKSAWKLTKLPKITEDYVGGKEKYGSYCLWHYVPISKSEQFFERYNALVGENARVVIWQDQSFLMTNDIGKGWNLPGGMLDKGETPEQCAIREIKEETNLTISNLELLCSEWVYYREKWWKTDIFETSNFYREIIPQTSEVTEIKFFTYQQVQAEKSDAITTFLPHLIKAIQRRSDKDDWDLGERQCGVNEKEDCESCQ